MHRSQQEMKKWNLYVKPPADECPEDFCFNWAPKGSFVSPGVHRNVTESLKALVPVSEGQCFCPFGFCRRLYPHPTLHDWYEPNEPELERHGLPWFYFIPSLNGLREDLKEEYIRESRRLWGKDQPHTSHDD